MVYINELLHIYMESSDLLRFYFTHMCAGRYMRFYIQNGPPDTEQSNERLKMQKKNVKNYLCNFQTTMRKEFSLFFSCNFDLTILFELLQLILYTNNKHVAQRNDIIASFFSLKSLFHVCAKIDKSFTNDRQYLTVIGIIRNLSMNRFYQKYYMNWFSSIVRYSAMRLRWAQCFHRSWPWYHAPWL